MCAAQGTAGGLDGTGVAFAKAFTRGKGLGGRAAAPALRRVVRNAGNAAVVDLAAGPVELPARAIEPTGLL